MGLGWRERRGGAYTAIGRYRHRSNAGQASNAAGSAKLLGRSEEPPLGECSGVGLEWHSAFESENASHLAGGAFREREKGLTAWLAEISWSAW